jgi:hypothetical protein
VPADATEWDVSGLLHDGQPFSRETVSCWLQCGYHTIYRTAAELDSDSISILSTVSGLAQVLAFANAVGSYEGLLQTACSQLQQLTFVVQLPEQVLELPVAGYTYWFNDNQLTQFNLNKAETIGDPVASDEQRHVVQQQVAKQAAALLQSAHVLRLQSVLDLLHQFLIPNTWAGCHRLLSDVAGLVFTDAVLEAALGSSTLSKEAYISSVLSQPCSLAPGKRGYSSLLKPVGPKRFDPEKELLMFDAQLLQDFAGAKAGDTVKVALDLFGKGYDGDEPGIKVVAAAGESFVTLPLQLWLGHSFNEAALQEFLKPAADA